MALVTPKLFVLISVLFLPDARLQRPEYLGGGSTPINVNPIAQTTPQPSSGTVTPQGNLAAMATLKAAGHGFVKSFTEHGYVIGLCMVRADLNYQQGLNRLWSRSTRFDFIGLLFLIWVSKPSLIRKFIVTVLRTMLLFLVIRSVMPNIVISRR